MRALVSSGLRGTSGGLLDPLVLVSHLMFPSRATKSKVSGDLRLYSSAIVNSNSPPPRRSVMNGPSPLAFPPLTAHLNGGSPLGCSLSFPPEGKGLT